MIVGEHRLSREGRKAMKVSDVKAQVSLTTKQWEALISILVPIKDQEVKFEDPEEVVKVSDLLTGILIDLQMVPQGTAIEWDT